MSAVTRVLCCGALAVILGFVARDATAQQSGAAPPPIAALRIRVTGELGTGPTISVRASTQCNSGTIQ